MNLEPDFPIELVLDETTRCFHETLVSISAERARSRRPTPNLFPLFRRFGGTGVTEHASALIQPLALANDTSDIARLAECTVLGLLLSPKSASVSVDPNGDIIVITAESGTATASCLPVGGPFECTTWLGEHVAASEPHVTLHIAPHRLLQVPVDAAHELVLERIVDGAPFAFLHDHTFTRAPGIERNPALRDYVIDVLVRG